MGGEAATFAGTYSYIETYEGTPELHPVTGPDKDAAWASAGTSTAQAMAAANGTRHPPPRRRGISLPLGVIGASRSQGVTVRARRSAELFPAAASVISFDGH